MKSFAYAGEWWLPSQENHKVAGEASFEGSGYTTLALHGIFAPHFKLGEVDSFPWYPIILGVTKASQPITLFRCQQTSASFSFGDDGEEGEEIYQADVALIGAHFTDPEMILFNIVDVQYSYLPQWAGIFPYRGYQNPFDEVRASTAKGTITVQLIRDVWDKLTRETDLIKESGLPEVVRIRCEIQEALALEGWTDQYVFPLQHLISLATQRPNAIVNIVGYVKQNGPAQSNSDGSDIPVQIAFPPAIIPIPTSESTTPRDILFSLEEIASNFSHIIEIWLQNADELNSVYKLFFGVLYTNLLLDLRFLLIAQAVEAYQDRRFEKTAFAEEVYQDLVKTVLAACPDEEKREWVAGALEFSNHATFRQQLRNLITQTNAVLKPLLGANSTKRNEFAEVVYNTRNYLTHHTEELAARSASRRELLYITRCLALILQVCLMKELGFTTQRLIEIVSKHKDYRIIPLLQSKLDLEKLT